MPTPAEFNVAAELSIVTAEVRDAYGTAAVRADMLTEDLVAIALQAVGVTDVNAIRSARSAIRIYSPEATKALRARALELLADGPNA